MLRKKFTLNNQHGLHARAAGKFVAHASRYVSTINVCCKNRCINAKSIMAVLTLAAGNGSEIELQIEGSDEQEALKDMEWLITDKFGERE